MLRTALLAPIFVPQALWVAARASRLPEAVGKRSGCQGQGPEKSLLILGDSSAAGVGVSHQDDALAGQLVSQLSTKFTVNWQVIAKSGETTAGTLRTLASLPNQQFDFCVIALGVNDAKNGVGFTAWRRRYTEIVEVLTEKFGASAICMSGLPPIRDFPLLPSPLSTVIGARAEKFDRVLRDLAREKANAIHLPTHFALDASKMAPDGFHPGPEVYAEWARQAAALLTGLQD